MKDRYLEVTFRKGKPPAAYLYLPHDTGAGSVRTVSVEPGLLVDYDEHEQPIGIEITAPATVTLFQVNSILENLNLPPLSSAELAPLHAA